MTTSINPSMKSGHAGVSRKPLRYWRQRAGLSQESLGEAIGVAQVQISDYEIGRRIPSGPRLQQIAALLGCCACEIDLGVAVESEVA